jgi:hypothetical protein
MLSPDSCAEEDRNWPGGSNRFFNSAFKKEVPPNSIPLIVGVAWAELSFHPEPSQVLRGRGNKWHCCLLRSPKPTPQCRYYAVTATVGTGMVDIVELPRWCSTLPDRRHRGRAPVDTHCRHTHGQSACTMHIHVEEHCTATIAPSMPRARVTPNF